MILLFLLTAMVAGPVSDIELVVIANPDVPVDRLAPEEVRAIFLGTKPRWPDGSTVVPVVLDRGKVHETFIARFIGRSPALFTRYWLHLIFHGVGTPPQSVSREDVAVSFVAETPGAVGYARADQLLEGVKILSVGPR